MVDIYFRNVHFKEVGLQFDCSPRSAKIRSRRRFKGISLYWWWQWGRRCEHCKREKATLNHQLSQTDISANLQVIGPLKPSTFKPLIFLHNLKNEKKKSQILLSGDHESFFLFLSHANLFYFLAQITERKKKMLKNQLHFPIPQVSWVGISQAKKESMNQNLPFREESSF